ncbi:hypothetical protein S7711_04742, partial [Stachybotrys chartarum IBT 7711]
LLLNRLAQEREGVRARESERGESALCVDRWTKHPNDERQVRRSVAAADQAQCLHSLPAETSKCSGLLPCDRCVSRGESCTYQDRVWRTKDDLRTEIANLQDSVAQVMALLERLTLAQSNFKIEPDLVREVQQGTPFGNVMRMLGVEYHASENGFSVDKDADGRLVPSASTAGTTASLPAQSAQDSPVDETASPPTDPGASSDVLGQSHAYQWHPATPPSITTSPSTGLPVPAADQSWSGSKVGTSPLPPATQPSWAMGPAPGEEAHNVRFSPASQQVASTQWGFLGIDIDEVHRAVGVYLEWELPGYSAICKEPFLEDLSTQRRRFCSEALVCAIMARSYQMEYDGDRTTREFRIKRLYNQARTLLIVERDALETMYPFIQTLTILASIEIVDNRMQEAWDLAFEAARLAILDALDHMERPQASDEHLQVRANAFCGAVSLPRLIRLVLAKGEPLDAPLFMRLGTNSDETPESRIERGIRLQRHFCALLPWCPPRNAFTWQVTEQAHTYMMFHFNEGCLQQNKADLFEVYPMLTKCFEAWMARPENQDMSPAIHERPHAGHEPAAARGADRVDPGAAGARVELQDELGARAGAPGLPFHPGHGHAGRGGPGGPEPRDAGDGRGRGATAEVGALGNGVQGGHDAGGAVVAPREGADLSGGRVEDVPVTYTIFMYRLKPVRGAPASSGVGHDKTICGSLLLAHGCLWKGGWEHHGRRR